jgi:hypothetical protein
MAHSPQNYTIGKGIVYIGAWKSGNTVPPAWPGDYTDVGNCTSMQLEPSLEKLPHYSSRAGFREKDLDPIVQMEYNVQFDLDEPTAENLAMFFQGTMNGTIMQAMMNTLQEYAIRFVSDNAAGPNRTYDCWRVAISPNGPLQLIGEEYMAMSYQGEGLADRTNHPDSPFFSIETDPDGTAVTTTTISA